MELYTTSSYNEGETMSSISEKSSMQSANNNQHQQQQQLLNHHSGMMTTSLVDDNMHHNPHALSTYLVDPPLMARSVTLDGIYHPTPVNGGELISPYIHRHVHHPGATTPGNGVPASLTIEGLAQLASSVAAETSSNNLNGNEALYSVVNKKKGDNNYEDTESEYAVELRRQAYLQAIGE